MLRGYIDESYDGKQKIFALSCLISTGSQWFHLERDWKVYLAGVNRQLKKQGRQQLSRYHASDCSSRKGEFEDWTTAEQIQLVTGLFSILKRHPTKTVAYATNLDDLCDILPEARPDRLGAAHTVLTKFVMVQIMSDMRGMRTRHPSLKVVIFHDRSSYDSTMQDAFNVMISAPEYADFFPSITPQSWEHCIALQPADLVAFEMFKEAQRQGSPRLRRKSMDALLDMKTFGVQEKFLTKDILLEAIEIMKREELRPGV